MMNNNYRGIFIYYTESDGSHRQLIFLYVVTVFVAQRTSIPRNEIRLRMAEVTAMLLLIVLKLISTKL